MASTRGRRPTPEYEKNPPVHVTSPVPDVPDWLCDKARDEWNRLAGPLHDSGRLEETDVVAFALYCQTYGEYQYYAKLAALERTMTRDMNRNGQLTTSPSAIHAQRLMKELRSYMAEFGLTPGSRGKPQAIPTNTDDGFDDATGGT